MESEETDMNGTTADEVEADTLKGGQEENEDIPPNWEWIWREREREKDEEKGRKGMTYLFILFRRSRTGRIGRWMKG